MHVVFVIDHLGSGGAQRQVVELAARLQGEAGLRVSVLAYHADDFHGARLRETGVPVLRLPRRGRFDLRLALRLGRWLARERADVVHAFLLPPALWSWLALRGLPPGRRPRLVAAERSSLIATTRGQALLQRLVYRGSDAVTANAEPVVEAIHRRLGVPRARLHYIPNGIDLAAWDAEAARPSPIPLEAGRFHLALVGGLRPVKAHELLFEALGRLGPERTRGWRLWCVGGRTAGSAAAERVEAAVAHHGLGDVVRLVPPVQEIAAFMRGLDALVLPSHYEGFPNVVLEAMASRLPVVATSVGDVPSLVEPGATGFRVPPGDAGALAEALERLAALSPYERRALGERGRAAVEARYGMDAVAAAHRRLYAELHGARGRRAASTRRHATG